MALKRMENGWYVFDGPCKPEDLILRKDEYPDLYELFSQKNTVPVDSQHPDNTEKSFQED